MRARRKGGGFNSRSRGGSDLVHKRRLGTKKFQFTLPRGERPRNRRSGSATSRFNSRSRGGSDQGTPRSIGEVLTFQFTLPRGERHADAFLNRLRKWFQFTLPRGERLKVMLQVEGHTLFQFTLPRGERLSSSVRHLRIAAFQFTLPRGERRILGAERIPRHGFNSRSRGGSDFIGGAVFAGRLVSIHAPAGGATRVLAVAVSASRFQFTLPRGERLADLSLRQLHARFNSRSRGGSDLVAVDIAPLSRVSIHAPAGGATPSRSRRPTGLPVSIHAPAGGATPFLSC